MNISRSERRALVWLAAIKAVAALVATPFYARRYEGLLIDYFDEAAARAFASPPLRLGTGTGNTIALTGLVSRLAFASRAAVEIIFSLIGLAGIWLFYRAFVLAPRREEPRLLCAVALCPTVLFWSSLVGKEPLTLLGLGLFAYGLAAREALAAAAGILIASYVRVWLAPLLLPSALIVLAAAGIAKRRKLALAAALAAFAAFALARFDVSFGEWNEARRIAAETYQGGGSSFAPPAVDSPLDALARLPVAAFTALFRPLPGEAPGMPGLAVGLENLFLLALALFAAARARRGDFSHPLILAALAFLALWSAFYGLTVFNFGALSRYKAAVLPLLLGLSLARIW